MMFPVGLSFNYLFIPLTFNGPLTMSDAGNTKITEAWLLTPEPSVRGDGHVI